MTQPTPPRCKHRKDDRPAKILSAALDAFAKNSFAETRLADVAKRAGVAKGTLYLDFDNKQDLFAAALRHGLLGPMLFHQVFGSGNAHAPDLHALAEQHGRLLLHEIAPRSADG